MFSRNLIASALLAAGALLVPALPVSAAEFDINASASRVLELTNMERAKAGVPPLKLSGELTAAAQDYSNVLVQTGCFAHTCGAVENFADRIGLAGYSGMTAAAENIAEGYPTPEAVVDGWMNSAGHRDNLLSPTYTEIGIGVAAGGPYGIAWTQDFGSRHFASPAAAAPASDEDASD